MAGATPRQLIGEVLLLTRFFFLFILSLSVLTAGQASASGNPEVPTAVDLSQEPTAPDAALRADTADSQRYAFEIKASNARLQLKVNGIPVVFKIFRHDDTLDVSFNEWLKKGLNVIDVQMERFSDGQPYSAKYSLYFQSPTQVVTGERTVLFSSPESISFPHRQPIGIRAQSIPSMLIWQTERIELMPDEKDRLVDSINSLRSRIMDALSKGDNAYLATFDKPIRDEIDKAYGRIPEGEDQTMKRRIDIAERLRKMTNASLVASPELKVDDLSFELIGDGYLVRVTRLDGSPVIKVSRGDLSFSVVKPIYGTVGGLWDMLRN